MPLQVYASLMLVFLANNLLNHFVPNLQPAFQQRTVQALPQTNKLPKKLSLFQFRESFVQKVG